MLATAPGARELLANIPLAFRLASQLQALLACRRLAGSSRSAGDSLPADAQAEILPWGSLPLNPPVDGRIVNNMTTYYSGRASLLATTPLAPDACSLQAPWAQKLASYNPWPPQGLAGYNPMFPEAC